uniref:DUF1618 domain-containing protein n=1 Tax=Oryza nivara TaxID=4536 RepID=A0A0E0FFK1_ORYNI
MMSMKLLVDSKAQRVLYAEEAGKDVVDFLSSLLTLPVATVVKLLSKDSMVASIVKLYATVQERGAATTTYDDVCSAAAAMNIQLEPATKLYRCSTSRFSDCHDYLPECDGKMTLPVKRVLLSSSSLSSSTSSGSSGGEAAAVATYTIMDDIKVAAMSATALLKSGSVNDINYLQEKTVQIGYIEHIHRPATPTQISIRPSVSMGPWAEVPDSVFVPLGRSAVLVSAAGADDDDYIFADIVTSRSPRGINPALPKATIFARVKNGGEWIQSSIPHLPLPPHLCGPTYFFHIDTAFSFAGTIFWVDLLKGILICDDILSSPQGPRLVFVPLPHCIDAHDKPRHCFSPDGHRSIGRVSGAIKFLALIGYCEASCPANEVKLKTWSLSPDFKHWEEETTLTVGDIWASESFNQMGLPHVLPFSPLISVNEDGIMYAVLNHVEKEPIPDQLNEFGESLGMQLIPKANYMIRFGMLQNKVLSSTKISKKPTLRWFTMTFLASDFSAYLQDRQNAEAAGKVGASAKGKRKRMSSRQAVVQYN